MIHITAGTGPTIQLVRLIKTYLHETGNDVRLNKYLSGEYIPWDYVVNPLRYSGNCLYHPV